MENPDCLAVIKENWELPVRGDDAASVLSTKLRRLRKRL